MQAQNTRSNGDGGEPHSSHLHRKTELQAYRALNQNMHLPADLYVV